MCCDGEVKQQGFCQVEARTEPEEPESEPTSVCDNYPCVNGDCVVFAGPVSF